MKLEFNYGSEIAALPAAVLREKLAAASETEIKLFCALAVDESLCTDYSANADAAAETLKCTREELDRALAFWRGTGAINVAGAAQTKAKKARASDVPHYTGEETAEIIDQNGLASVIDECGRILRRTFNPTDVNSIVAMYQQLGVDEAYILMLCDYCARIDKRSLAYVRKRAYDLYDDGVDTAEKLEAYIRAHDDLFDFTGELRHTFGIEGRALTSKENTLFEKWCTWGYSADIVRRAYEITVEKTGKYSVAYLDAILANWHEAGYTTLEEIDQAQQKYADAKAAEKSEKEQHKGSFDTNEFLEAALKHTRASVLKIKKESGE